MSRSTGTASEDFVFRYGGGGQWPIDVDRDVVYVADGTGTRWLRIDGEMSRRPEGQFSVDLLGPTFSPLDLFGRDSVLGNLSAKLSLKSGLEPIEVNGRSAWAVALSDQDSDQDVEISFDDSTGVPVQLQLPGNDGNFSVTLSAIADALGSELFTWSGPIADTADDPADLTEQRIDIMGALSVALDRPHDVVNAVARSDDDQQALSRLMDELGISEVGAQAVLAMQVRRMTRRGVDAIRLELSELSNFKN